MSTKKIFLAAILFPLWGLGGLHAQSIISSGYCGANAGGGTNLTWTLYSDSSLTIYGSGNMGNFWDYWNGGDLAPWKTYRSRIKTVIIGDSVNTIGNYAFGDCSNLTFVSIGNSVTIIYDDAFYGCSNLTSITIPNSVIIIRYEVFRESGLTSVSIPNSVTTIGSGAFELCNSLTSVIIGNSVTTIENYAFYNCSNLASITVYAAIPPILSASSSYHAFTGVPDTIPIYVPCGSVSAYQSAWTYFSNFIGFTDDTTFFYDTICPNTIYNGNGFSINEGAGIYYRAEKTAQNCDSIICLTLTEYPQPITYYSAGICQGDTYSDSNFTDLTDAGTYYDTLQTIHGCDSIIELNLVFHLPSVITQISDSICAGGSYNFGSRTLTEDGIYYDTLQTINGCDSIIELNLAVHVPSVLTQISDSIASGTSYNFGGKLLTESGIYYDTLQNTNGCDSIIELTLKVSNVGIVSTTLNNQIRIYPNPTDGQLTIEYGSSATLTAQERPLSEVEVEIYDVVGQLLLSLQSLPSLQQTIDISHLPAGIYFIKLQTNQGIITKKIIKK